MNIWFYVTYIALCGLSFWLGFLVREFHEWITNLQPVERIAPLLTDGDLECWDREIAADKAERAMG
jgi:hypothetical protein